MDVSSPLASARPITAQLSSLSSVIGSCPDSALPSTARDVERLFMDLESRLGSSTQGAGLGELEECLSVSRALIGRCSLPLAADDVSPAAEAELEAVAIRAEAVSPALLVLLRILGKDGGMDEGGGASERVLFVAAPDVCVFAVTHFQVAPWSSPSSRSAAQAVMRALLEAWHWTDSAHMLMGDRGGAKGILGGVLDLLQPQLNKDAMFRCDAVKLVFSWTLLQVTRPALSPHLPRLLPPSLLLADHYRPENCLLGVRCLHHIVLNAAAAELRQLNRAEVVYQALFRLLYQAQPQVTQAILLCLMDLLLVLEKPPSVSPVPFSISPAPSVRAVSRHDAVLRLVLTQMEAEHKVALRRVYASALPPLVDRCGIAVCRHMKRLERVTIGFLEVSDPPDETSRIQTLHTLNRTLSSTWPRVDRGRAERFLKAVLQLLVDVSSDSNVTDAVKQEVFDQSETSIRRLDACLGGTLQCLLLQVDSGHCSSEVLRVLCSATAKTQT
uniref:TELO2-interacting protein 2 n=1 Tax=Neogobius melanostomus TaxID=47308 RepID=A0A8C6WPE7_9GOBI